MSLGPSTTGRFRHGPPPGTRHADRTPLALLGLLCLMPAVQTAVAIHCQWHPAITYPALKALMIVAPIVVWRRSRRSASEVRRRLGLKRTRGLAGLALGALMSAVILGGYYAVLRPAIDPAGVLAKARSMGLLEHYWTMALVIALGNSLFEEYYWRGFIVSELGAWTRSTTVVVAVAGGMFGLHHVFAMLALFELPLLALFVLGTMLAGGVWTWMRRQGRSILDCYISHVFADLAILWVGYDLIGRAR